MSKDTHTRPFLKDDDDDVPSHVVSNLLSDGFDQGLLGLAGLLDVLGREPGHHRVVDEAGLVAVEDTGRGGVQEPGRLAARPARSPRTAAAPGRRRSCRSSTLELVVEVTRMMRITLCVRVHLETRSRIFSIVNHTIYIHKHTIQIYSIVNNCERKYTFAIVL